MSFFLLTTVYCVWLKATLEFVRDRDGLKGIAAHGDEDEMGFCDEHVFAFASHFKVEPQGLRADVPDEGADFEQIIELRGVAEVAFEVGARKPHVQLVEHHAVRETDGAEKLRLGKLEEAYVSAVEDDARCINIAPAHALLDAILQTFTHLLVEEDLNAKVAKREDAKGTKE